MGQLLTLEQVAVRLGTSVATVKRMRDAGRLAVVQVGTRGVRVERRLLGSPDTAEGSPAPWIRRLERPGRGSFPALWPPDGLGDTTAHRHTFFPRTRPPGLEKGPVATARRGRLACAGQAGPRARNQPKPPQPKGPTMAVEFAPLAQLPLCAWMPDKLRARIEKSAKAVAAVEKLRESVKETEVALRPWATDLGERDRSDFLKAAIRAYRARGRSPRGDGPPVGRRSRGCRRERRSRRRGLGSRATNPQGPRLARPRNSHTRHETDLAGMVGSHHAACDVVADTPFTAGLQQNADAMPSVDSWLQRLRMWLETEAGRQKIAREPRERREADEQASEARATARAEDAKAKRERVEALL